MSIVPTSEYLAYGRRVNSEMVALEEAVTRSSKATKNRVPPPAWWQRWEGFYGSWTQYYNENIVKNQILPLQDDGDLTEWAKQADTWKIDFAKEQAKGGVNELAGPLGKTDKVETSNPLGDIQTATKVVLIVGVVASVGYLLSSAARIAGR